MCRNEREWQTGFMTKMISGDLVLDFVDLSHCVMCISLQMLCDKVSVDFGSLEIPNRH